MQRTMATNRRKPKPNKRNTLNQVTDKGSNARKESVAEEIVSNLYPGKTANKDHKTEPMQKRCEEVLRQISDALSLHEGNSTGNPSTKIIEEGTYKMFDRDMTSPTEGGPDVNKEITWKDEAHLN